jgi:hypothetical protein
MGNYPRQKKGCTTLAIQPFIINLCNRTWNVSAFHPHINGKQTNSAPFSRIGRENTIRATAITGITLIKDFMVDLLFHLIAFVF